MDHVPLDVLKIIVRYGLVLGPPPTRPLQDTKSEKQAYYNAISEYWTLLTKTVKWTLRRRLVCRRWKEIIDTHAPIWKQMALGLDADRRDLMVSADALLTLYLLPERRKRINQQHGTQLREITTVRKRIAKEQTRLDKALPILAKLEAEQAAIAARIGKGKRAKKKVKSDQFICSAVLHVLAIHS